MFQLLHLQDDELLETPKPPKFRSKIVFQEEQAKKLNTLETHKNCETKEATQYHPLTCPDIAHHVIQFCDFPSIMFGMAGTCKRWNHVVVCLQDNNDKVPFWRKLIYWQFDLHKKRKKTKKTTCGQYISLAKAYCLEYQKMKRLMKDVVQNFKDRGYYVPPIVRDCQHNAKQVVILQYGLGNHKNTKLECTKCTLIASIPSGQLHMNGIDCNASIIWAKSVHGKERNQSKQCHDSDCCCLPAKPRVVEDVPLWQDPFDSISLFMLRKGFAYDMATIYSTFGYQVKLKLDTCEFAWYIVTSNKVSAINQLDSIWYLIPCTKIGAPSPAVPITQSLYVAFEGLYS